GKRIVEIVIERSFNSWRGCFGNTRTGVVGSNGMGGFVRRIIVQQEILFERRGKLVVHGVGGSRFESRLANLG
ncbi:hypothetical protein, partial [Mesorhizobium sp.]|uniref:hypothetical protein n=1 Tax=Mesorhizobium sp. TaxID=1871066 RepID=UPI00257E39B9